MLTRLKVGVKIGGGFTIVLLLTVVVALTSIFSIRTMTKNTKEATGLRVDEMKLASAIKCSMINHAVLARGYMLYGDASYLDKFGKERDLFKDKCNELSALLTSKSGKQVMEDMENGEADYSGLFQDKVLPAYKSGNMTLVKKIAGTDLAAANKTTFDACEKMSDIAESLMDKATSSANQAGRNALVVVWVLTGISLLIGACVSILITRAIVHPITSLVEDSKRIAEGDLTVDIKQQGTDEIGQLSISFKEMVSSLRQTVAKVSAAAANMAASSQELSATSEEVTKGTQQIAETVDQVAAGSQEQSKTAQSSASSMDQLRTAISEVASGAQNQARTVESTVSLVQQITAAIEEVARLSQESAANGQKVSEIATTGGAHVADAVNGMGKIKEATDKVANMVQQLGESSQQIGAIVETIDDIAEQTNLLALNAAIEAARAGEHGKGFAVVADEVRKLAERSSKATGEIADLIGSIQTMTGHAVDAMNKGSQEVADGTDLANQAGVALRQIQSAVDGIVKQIEQTSASTQHVSESSIEVVRAIENVSAVTEQTSAATEEMAASSAEVAHQIEQVAALSEESAAAAEEVSATTQEQNASAEELTASAEELARMAEELQELVSHFKLSDSDVKLGALQDISERVVTKSRKRAA